MFSSIKRAAEILEDVASGWPVGTLTPYVVVVAGERSVCWDVWTGDGGVACDTLEEAIAVIRTLDVGGLPSIESGQ